MLEVKTSRPYRERFLDGYDRHQLRTEVRKVKPSKRFSRFQTKAVSWALGGALALGGIGIPLKMGLSGPPPATGQLPGTGEKSLVEPAASTTDILKDLKTAQKIASQVTGGVSSAVQDVAQVASQVPAAAAEAPKAVADVAASVAKNAAELVKEHFFTTEVPFGQLIYQEAKKNSLPPELLAAVVHTESAFIPNARSQAGAIGLMQLVPRTGRWLGAQDLTNPRQNVMAGAKYLRYLTDRFNGNTQNAVAAYNAGEGNVRRFGGVPPFRETRNYVSRVQDYQNEIGQRIAGHDIQLASVQVP